MTVFEWERGRAQPCERLYAETLCNQYQYQPMASMWRLEPAPCSPSMAVSSAYNQPSPTSINPPPEPTPLASVFTGPLLSVGGLLALLAAQAAALTGLGFDVGSFRQPKET